MDKQAYFKRIGLPAQTEIAETYEFLRKLHYHHVLSVPYENLDLIDGALLSLEPADVFHKVVHRHRGGYCFELNGLLSAFLKENGFAVENYLGRFLRHEESIPIRRHRILAVTCAEGVYVCDVGIGQSAPRYPLKLEEGLIQEQLGETYKFEKDAFHGWILYDLYKGAWRPFYSFTEDKQLDIDFVPPSFYCERHPDSAFNKVVMVALKTAEGRKTIHDREFKIFQGEKLVYCESKLTDERRRQLLAEEFQLQWEPAYTQ